MATGTPVFCVCDQEGPLGMEVTQYDLGITATWEQLDQRIEDLLAVTENNNRYQTLQENVYERSKAYHRDAVIAFIESELGRLVR